MASKRKHVAVHGTSSSLYEMRNSRAASAYYRARTNSDKNNRSTYASAHANSVYGRRKSYNYAHIEVASDRVHVRGINTKNASNMNRNNNNNNNTRRSRNIAYRSQARSMDISNAQKVCKEYYFTYGVAPKKVEHLMKFATSIGRKLAYADARLAIHVCKGKFNDMVSTNDDIIAIENKTKTNHAVLSVTTPRSLGNEPIVLRDHHNEEMKIAGNDDYYDDCDVPIALNAGVFNAKCEEEYNVLPRAHDQCADEKSINGIDKRQIYDTTKVNWSSRIGLLRMKFKGIDKTFIGTATVFYCNEESKRCYGITCAHNLRHYDAMEKKHHRLESLWFEHRLTSNWWGAKYTSSCIKRYNIDHYTAHFKFDPTKTIKPFDLGIVSFTDSVGFYTKQKKELNDMKSFANAALLGYPGEKKGQLWGDWNDNNSKKKYGDVFSEKEFPELGGVKMVSYDMQTTAGQSGSSIVFNKKIVAIHTMGANKNWGIKLEKVHRDWIEKKVLQIEGKKKLGKIRYCTMSIPKSFRLILYTVFVHKYIDINSHILQIIKNSKIKS